MMYQEFPYNRWNLLLTICVPSYSVVEDLTPNLIVFGDRTSKKIIRDK